MQDALLLIGLHFPEAHEAIHAYKIAELTDTLPEIEQGLNGILTPLPRRFAPSSPIILNVHPSPHSNK